MDMEVPIPGCDVSPCTHMRYEFADGLPPGCGSGYVGCQVR
jgi:hypothetical protein